MWYVKDTLVSTLFLLNSCFILTMWYVKKGEKGDKGDTGKGFILTMWYVKNVRLVKALLLFRVLY